MGKILSIINIAFFIELLFVILIAIGILPREGALFLAVFLSVIFIISSLEDSVMFTARSIPLFLALPITESFDNFNIWRILVLILFVKLLFLQKQKLIIILKNTLLATKKSAKETVLFLYQNYKLEFLSAILLLIAVLSLLKAENPVAGIKRIIYFLNLGMLFFVVRHIINRGNFMRLGHNFIFSGIIIAFVGSAQLVLAYLMPINNFVEFWALTIEKNLYGNAWAQIAISANTWFAYFNGTIHLRMFSWFPDSHSFPLYLLIVSTFIATFIASTPHPFQTNINKYNKMQPTESPTALFKFIKKLCVRKGAGQEKTIGQICGLAYILLGIFSLELVLSGTRGIWMAIVAPILILIYWMKNNNKIQTLQGSIRHGGLSLWLPILFFIAALIISQPIFNSGQFKLTENETEESRVLISRLTSIFDTKETSNQGRIWIWKESAKSIIKNPLLGVGIGNFPAVLKQNIALAKAGSSAHNLFLQILAEMGIFAFIIFLIIIYEIYKKIKNLSRDENILINPHTKEIFPPETKIDDAKFYKNNNYKNSVNISVGVKFFGLFSTLYIAWILAYSMTDPAIFDERVFLGLMILIGTIYAISNQRLASR